MQIVKTHEYRLTCPIKRPLGITKVFKLAFLFKEQERIKTRYEIFRKLGYSKKDSKRKGWDSCMFTALNSNKIIEYDVKAKTYIRGENWKEYMQFCITYMEQKHLTQKYRKLYTQLLEICNPSMHFIKS
jgi:hypothetical protein